MNWSRWHYTFMQYKIKIHHTPFPWCLNQTGNMEFLETWSYITKFYLLSHPDRIIISLMMKTVKLPQLCGGKMSRFTTGTRSFPSAAVWQLKAFNIISNRWRWNQQSQKSSIPRTYTCCVVPIRSLCAPTSPTKTTSCDCNALSHVYGSIRFQDVQCVKAADVVGRLYCGGCWLIWAARGRCSGVIVTDSCNLASCLQQ